MCPVLFCAKIKEENVETCKKPPGGREKDDVRISKFLDMIAPSVIKFETDYFILRRARTAVFGH